MGEAKAAFFPYLPFSPQYSFGDMDRINPFFTLSPPHVSRAFVTRDHPAKLAFFDWGLHAFPPSAVG